MVPNDLNHGNHFSFKKGGFQVLIRGKTARFVAILVGMTLLIASMTKFIDVIMNQ